MQLTAAQAAQVRVAVASGRVGSAAQIRDVITETFGVGYRPRGSEGQRRRLAARPMVPRPRHAKADPAAQAAGQKVG